MAESLTILSDIKFYYEANSMETLGPADIKVTGNALHTDPGLETSVLISLFSHGRANDADILPHGFETRGGWWGTSLDPKVTLSKRWLLGRSVIDQTTFKLCEQYDKDSLQWMIDDGIAASIDSLAVRGGLYQINSIVTINRAQGDIMRFKYFRNWEHQSGLVIGGLS